MKGKVVAFLAAELEPLDTVDDIATWMRSHDIRGEQGVPYACPVAAAIQREAPDANIYVGNDYVAVNAWLDAPDRIALPAPIPAFISMFDSGSFPDLILRGNDDDEDTDNDE